MFSPFEQNVIAVVWDFDKTLISEYMQTPIFEKYSVDGSLFWQEVNELEEKYKMQKPDIRINSDTIYLNHFLTCVRQGIFKGLNNSILFELGKELKYYPGMPDFLAHSKELIDNNEKYQKYNITVEHYIVSTGMAEMIRGSQIAKYVKGIWGCEFIEEPIKSTIEFKEYEKTTIPNNEEKEISQIGYTVDNTSKTRAIFEINKGTNINEEINVNSSIDRAIRRIPFDQIIYVADGPSDVPAFSMLKQNGGSTFAVYPKGGLKEFRQVDQLRIDKRIDMYGEADYRENTTTYLWLINKIRDIANQIHYRKGQIISQSYSKAPGHIND